MVNTVRLDTRDWSPSVWFSDADQIGVITSTNEVGIYLYHVLSFWKKKLVLENYFKWFFFQDGFVVKTLNPNVKPVTITSELSLKLARKCIDVMGSSSFDEDSGNKTLNFDFDDEILSIVSGKEFGLIRTTSGKVCIVIVSVNFE